jgi:hypothetical protein
MQLFDDVAYGDLEQGSIYERSEANLMKVRRHQLRCQLVSAIAQWGDNYTMWQAAFKTLLTSWQRRVNVSTPLHAL